MSKKKLNLELFYTRYDKLITNKYYKLYKIIYGFSTVVMIH